MDSVGNLTHVEEFSNHDNSRFNYNGTAQPCNAFKINNVLSNLNFVRPEGDFTMTADYKASIPAADPDMDPPTIMDLGTRTYTIPSSVTTLDNSRDYIVNNSHLGSLVIFSPSPRYQDINLSLEYPPELVPDNLPDNHTNVSTLTVPARPDTFRLGFNRTDEPVTYTAGQPLLLRSTDPPQLSYYMQTGNTHENDWHIGDVIAHENPHVSSMAVDVLRPGWYPISRSDNYDVHIRDHNGTSFSNLSSDSQIRLNTTFGTVKHGDNSTTGV